MVDGETINKSKKKIQHEIEDTGYLQDGERLSCKENAGWHKRRFAAASSTILLKLNSVS